MAKKNEQGFRNSIIKDYSPERIQLLINQRKILDGLSPEQAYRRIMEFYVNAPLFMSTWNFGNEAEWKVFIEELARVRENKKDGFFCYTLAQKLKGPEPDLLLEIVKDRILFGLITFYILKFVSKIPCPINDITEKVMKFIVSKNITWEKGEGEKYSASYRNFWGKANAIYEKREFVEYLISEFDIGDGRDADHTFPRAWANFYIWSTKLYYNGIEEFLPHEENKKSEDQTEVINECIKTDSRVGTKPKDVLSFVSEYIKKMRDAAIKDDEILSKAEEQAANARDKAVAALAAYEEAKKHLEDALMEKQSAEELLAEAQKNAQKSRQDWETVMNAIKVD